MFYITKKRFVWCNKLKNGVLSSEKNDKLLPEPGIVDQLCNDRLYWCSEVENDFCCFPNRTPSKPIKWLAKLCQDPSYYSESNSQELLRANEHRCPDGTVVFTDCRLGAKRPDSHGSESANESQRLVENLHSISCRSCVSAFWPWFWSRSFRNPRFFRSLQLFLSFNEGYMPASFEVFLRGPLDLADAVGKNLCGVGN